MQEEIRHWFVQHKEQTGKFPVYPSLSEGGSASLFAADAKDKNSNSQIEEPEETNSKKPLTASKKKISKVRSQLFSLNISSGRDRQEEPKYSNRVEIYSIYCKLFGIVSRRV